MKRDVPSVPVPSGHAGYGEIAEAVRARQRDEAQMRALMEALKEQGWSPERLRHCRRAVGETNGIVSAKRLAEIEEEQRHAMWNTQEWRDAVAEGMREKTPEEQKAYDIKQRRKRHAIKLESSNRRRARMRDARIESVNRLGIIERDARTCYLCRRSDLQDEQIHLDHVIPLSRGGAHSEDNLRVTCADCNIKKGALTADEFLARHRLNALSL